MRLFACNYRLVVASNKSSISRIYVYMKNSELVSRHGLGSWIAADKLSPFKFSRPYLFLFIVFIPKNALVVYEVLPFSGEAFISKGRLLKTGS